MLRPSRSHFQLGRIFADLSRLRLARIIRPSAALVLLIAMFTLSVPAPVLAIGLRKVGLRYTEVARRTEAGVARMIRLLRLQKRGQSRGMPSAPVNRPGDKPLPPPSRLDREARVASIQINTQEAVVLQSREPMLFAGIPTDSEGGTIQGLRSEWESSDRQVVFISKTGQALAGKPGTAILTAKAGRLRRSVRVTVIEGSKTFGQKKRENSRRKPKQIARNTTPPVSAKISGKPGLKRQHVSAIGHSVKAGVTGGRAPLPTLPLRDPNVDPLPDDETYSLYEPANNVGAPPGKTRPGANTRAAATEGTETGNKNFSFGLPIIGLSGRGIDVALNLTYNSLLYNKSVDPFEGSTWLTYDVDSGWPAPGFRIGYGQIEDQGTNGFTLTDADGTRHALNYTSPNNYDTHDGTFIHFSSGSGGGSLFYADGTRVDYGAAGGGFRSYPTKMVDQNGNFVLINYVNGVGPRISSIQDTLARFVRFYYAVNGDLVTITAPGLTGQPERQVLRFYYQDLSIDSSGLFEPTINVSAPASTRVIKYIYFPSSTEGGNAHLGYRYDYTAYGTMHQISLLRGMTVDSDALDQTGWISGEGLQAALTIYNYPITPSNLADVPAFTRRTDDWAGRTTGMPDTGEAPYYTFAGDQPNGVSTVTAPDNTVTETHTIVAPEEWNDGLLSHTMIKQGASSPVLARTDTIWELDANGRNARPQQLEMTNDAGQTTKVVLTYSSHNNVIVVSTRGFDGAEVRRVETDYQTNAEWTSRHLLHLPLSVRIYAGGATAPASRVDYAYDTAGANLTPRNDIIMHEAAFDPFAPMEENCSWQCTSVDEWGFCIWEWVCNDYNPYDPATDKRGNVTSVTNYADAANGEGAITNTSTYDIAGNVIVAQVDCCQQKSFTYSSSYFYAYPTSIISGAGPTLTTSFNYDFDTGLVASTTDENGQISYLSYHADTLRPEHVAYPNGGAVSFHYNDNLQTDAAGRQHFSASTSTKLDATRSVDSYRFFDGRGAVTQSFGSFTQANGWSTQDSEYDAMGRAYRTGNPYYSAGYGSVGINPTGLWTTRTFDNLGRVKRVDMPSGDAQNPTAAYATTEYAGVFTTAIDQSGKRRRQKTDALGHVVRLDEPDANGDLGATGAPNQSTTYEYDALSNLIHITQGSQQRYFKFDSLSRLTYERQVEQDAPHTTPDSVAGNNQWSRKIVYNSQGLVQDAYDARQVKTHFVYDGLNRVAQINYLLANGSPDPATPSAFYYYDAQALPAGAPTFDRGYATGRVVAMTYGSGASTTGNYFGYDQVGQIVSQRQVTGANAYALSYGYNLGGLTTSETYPSGRALSYDYDEGGRLWQVSEGSTVYASGFSYEPHGGLSAETFGNGAVHSVAYNHALQASEIKLKQSASGAELQRFNYLYGTVNQSNGSVDTTKNNGQIGRTDSYINGVKQWDQRVSYDSLGRLSTAAEYEQGNNNQLTWQTQYTFDPYGNRFQSGSGNSGVGYTPVLMSDIVEGRNRFISTGAQPINYDAAGNIIQDLKFRGMNYSYDANGRQIFVERDDHTNQQTAVYDCAGQRVQTTASGVTRTMVYDVFGQQVADYNGASLERENIYRGGQLLSVVETPTAAAPSALAAAPSSGGSSITLSWSAASGATNYRVERKDAGGSFALAGTSTSTGFTDNGVTSGNAYLYKVCAADGQNNCTSSYTNIALGATVTFPTDPTITSIVDDPTGVNVTKVKSAHVTELRTAVNAVRGLAGLANAGWTHPAATGDAIYADDVRDLRSALDEALVALAIQTSTYTDSSLAGAPNGTLIRKTHITELRERTKSGSGGTGSGGSSSGVRYVLSDVQGSSRAVMNNGTYGSSAIVARHDYLPFGQEIGSGTGLRTGTQGYNASDRNRQKYGSTERDGTSGLDHTWWRKYDSFSGRWTSPDPYGGSMAVANPQSFNRYSYVENDPVNLVDPSGLYKACVHEAMTNFLAKLAGYNDKIVGALTKATGSGPGGADSFRYSATNPINFILGIFGRGPQARIHLASAATLAKEVGRFDGYMAARNYQRAGFVLHSIEDVRGAHQGYRRPFGHAWDTLTGKDPDSVIGDARFMTASNEVFQLLSGNQNASLTAGQVNDLIDAIIATCGKKAKKLKITRPSPILGGPVDQPEQSPRWHGGGDPFDVFRWLDLWIEMERRERGRRLEEKAA